MIVMGPGKAAGGDVVLPIGRFAAPGAKPFAALLGNDAAAGAKDADDGTGTVLDIGATLLMPVVMAAPVLPAPIQVVTPSTGASPSSPPVSAAPAASMPPVATPHGGTMPAADLAAPALAALREAIAQADAFGPGAAKDAGVGEQPAPQQEIANRAAVPAGAVVAAARDETPIPTLVALSRGGPVAAGADRAMTIDPSLSVAIIVPAPVAAVSVGDEDPTHPPSASPAPAAGRREAPVVRSAPPSKADVVSPPVITAVALAVAPAIASSVSIVPDDAPPAARRETPVETSAAAVAPVVDGTAPVGTSPASPSAATRPAAASFVTATTQADVATRVDRPAPADAAPAAAPETTARHRDVSARPAPSVTAKRATDDREDSAPTPSDRALVADPVAVAPASPAPSPQSAVASPAAAVSGAAVERTLDLARQSAWIDDIARDIARAGDGQGVSRFTVAPAQLGTVEVTIARAGPAAEIVITAADPIARERLGEGRHRLAEEARAQGVELRSVRVEAPAATAAATAPGGDANANTNASNSLTTSGYGGGVGGEPRGQPQREAPQPQPQAQRAARPAAATPPRERLSGGRYA